MAGDAESVDQKSKQPRIIRYQKYLFSPKAKLVSLKQMRINLGIFLNFHGSFVLSMHVLEMVEELLISSTECIFILLLIHYRNQWLAKDVLYLSISVRQLLS